MSVLLTLSVINILTALGLRPQTPADAPPLAGFNIYHILIQSPAHDMNPMQPPGAKKAAFGCRYQA